MAVPHHQSGREAADRTSGVVPKRDRLEAPRSHDRRFSSIEEIALLAEQAAGTVADPTATLADAIQAAIASDADPYVLLGVLAEGTVQTLATNIPDARRWVALQGFLQIIGSRTQIKRPR